MATEPISDISSDEDDEVECLYTNRGGYDSEQESQESESDEEASSEEDSD